MRKKEKGSKNERKVGRKEGRKKDAKFYPNYENHFFCLKTTSASISSLPMECDEAEVGFIGTDSK